MMEHVLLRQGMDICLNVLLGGDKMFRLVITLQLAVIVYSLLVVYRLERTIKKLEVKE